MRSFVREEEKERERERERERESGGEGRLLLLVLLLSDPSDRSASRGELGAPIRSIKYTRHRERERVLGFTHSELFDQISQNSR